MSVGQSLRQLGEGIDTSSKLLMGAVRMAENQTGQKIKAVVSDNGGEFINKNFSEFFEKHGIIHLPTAPYTPQQNPVAERANWSLLEKMRVLLLDYQVPAEWWGEACSLATYLLNCTLVASLGFQTPIKKQTSKVAPTGILCIFLGNVEGHHNFRLYDPGSRRILITHNCTFKDGVSEPATGPETEVSLPETGAGTSTEEIGACSPQPVALLEKPLPKGWRHELVAETTPKDVTSKVSIENFISGKRSRKPPIRFAGAVVGTTPRSFREALASSKSNAWLTAVAKEFASLERHQVVKEVRLERNQRLLDTTWVFREKTDAEGNVTEEKARLCIKGFHQIEDVDFHETFAPTGRLATLRFLLGYCASNDFDIQQMDVKTAFLHGDLDEDIFIKIPEGYTPTMKGEVCLKLTKSLYGLRQSPSNWYLRIRRFFTEAGFLPSAADPCFFIRTSGDPCFVFLHMDNLVIGGLNLQVFKSEIVSTFEMKDLGELKYVLGMKVTRNRSMRTISLSQELYIANLLKDFGMQDCKPASTPLVPSLRLDPISNSNADPTNINCRRGVGLLNYLVSCTRPDIAFAVSCLAHFLNAPSVEHENAFKHVLRYLKGTKSWGITLGDVCNNSLIMEFCDTDWGSNYDSRSFSGSCVFCYGLVGWKTSKQEVVALSSTEAEYWSISSCCQDISWLLELTKDFGLALKGKLLCDNQGALSLLKNPLYQHQT
ncbi:hypothetical protein O181_078390 [Austropuccinia psidii MF-1]|uniref:Integrase catalytic domain-containing protein n=1 Tax=Austropuccinia psidii MF-1 TaxID=1389203 RepID=A0A9Q3IGX4_9BASI|nr:hypothetical protein [Austropuccinia psidii MF-1]